jgi:hypothetical protein
MSVVQRIAFGMIRTAEAGNGFLDAIDENRGFRNAPELEYPHASLMRRSSRPNV